MTQGFDGDLFERGDGAYETARRAAVWNGRTPDRFPDVIVQAHTEEDLIRAVRLARDRDLRIGVRSGGHSWAGNHLRDGGLLLDVSRLNAAEIDAPAMSASVQPGCGGSELVAALGEQDLFFPAGHCQGVAVGGYLLQGGYGWNGRVHGPACMSIEAIDVVTANGELVHADADQHPGLLWAARGSGPGFFGVVSRFHLRVYPKPKVVANGVFIYPMDVLDEVFRWAHEVGPQVARTMELMVVIHRDDAGEQEIVVTGPTLVGSEEEAREVLAVLQTCPVIDRAKLALPHVPVTMDDLYAGVTAAYPTGHRYAADNMWTHAPVEDLLPGLHRIADSMPDNRYSHMLWMNWGPGTTPAPERPDMVYSCEDDTYIALYGVWEDAATDGANAAWVGNRMREMEPFATGIQLADENLGQRPARFLTDENMARLDGVRTAYDPEGRFHPWMGRL